MIRHFLENRIGLGYAISFVTAKIVGLFDMLQASIGIEQTERFIDLMFDVFTVLVVGSLGYAIQKFWKWIWPDKTTEKKIAKK